MNPKLLLLAVACVFLLLPASGFALEARFTDNEAHTLINEARDARLRGEFTVADALLGQAQQEGAAPMALILYERGLLAHDQGDNEDALDLLAQSANLAPQNDARVEQAAILVELGRWPEAVTILQTAFDARGADLKAEGIATDPRFAQLHTFDPFQRMIRELREAQSGPMGKLLLRLDEVESATDRAIEHLGKVVTVLEILWELFSLRWFAVAVLLSLGTLMGATLRQMSIANPPWSFILGMSGALGAWHVLARIVTLGSNGGEGVIVRAALTAFIPTSVAVVFRMWRRRVRRRRQSAADEHIT